MTLAVIVLMPLYFNSYSETVFDLDKATLFKALISVFAFLYFIDIAASVVLDKKSIKAFYLRAADFNSLKVIAALFLISQFVATFFSVDVNVSIYGDNERAQGFLTLVAQYLLFLMVIRYLNNMVQFFKVLMAIVITCVPVSIYAVTQHYGADQIVWGGDVQARASSTLGNPTFLASYLLMVVPYIIGSLVLCLSASKNFRLTPSKGFADQASEARAFTWLAVLLGSLAVLALTAIVFTQSRGALLGVLVSLMVFSVLAYLRGCTKSGLLVIIITGVILAGIGGIKLASLPMIEGDSSVEYFIDSQGTSGNTANARLLLWGGISDYLLQPDINNEASDTALLFNKKSFWFGHGPSTLRFFSGQFYAPELAYLEQRGALADDAHSLVWNSFFASGILGLIALLALILVSFSHVLTVLYPQEKRRHLLTLICAFMFFAVISTGLILFLDNSNLRLLGITIVFSLIAALLSNIVWSRWRQLSLEPANDAERSDANVYWISASIAAVLCGYLVEQIFGVQTLVSTSYFWIALGMLIALGQYASNEDRATPDTAADVTSIWLTLKPFAANLRRCACLLQNLICLALLFSFSAHNVTSPHHLSYASLYALITALIFIKLEWLFINGVDRRNYLISRVLIYIAPVALVFSSELILSLFSVLKSSEHVRQYFVYLPMLLSTCIVALTLAFAIQRNTISTKSMCVAVFSVMLMAVWASWGFGSRLVANGHYKLALESEKDQQWTRCLTNVQRALRARVHQAEYLTLLSRCALQAEVLAVNRGTQKDKLELNEFVDIENVADAQISKIQWLSLSLNALASARVFAPHDADHNVNMAKLSRYMFDRNLYSTRRSEHLRATSIENFDTALRARPNDVSLWVEYASALSSFNDDKNAINALRESISIDPRYTPSYLPLARLLMRAGKNDKAIQVLQEGLHHSPGDIALMGVLAMQWAQQGKLLNALQLSEQIVELKPRNLAAIKNCASLAFRVRDFKKLEHWVTVGENLSRRLADKEMIQTFEKFRALQK